MEDENNEPFQLKLVGDGISIDKKLNRETARIVMSVVMGGGPTVQDVQQKANQASAKGPALSLREFLTDVQAQTKPDQIVAIGHFVIDHEAQASFTKDEVKARFAAAKEPMPANFPRDFGAAVKAGMIDEVHGERGRYYVTRTGQQAVENRFGRSRS